MRTKCKQAAVRSDQQCLYAQFKREVKRLFGFGPEVEFDVSFSVPAPSFGRHQSATHHIGGQNLNLNGLSQFGEHCNLDLSLLAA